MRTKKQSCMDAYAHMCRKTKITHKHIAQKHVASARLNAPACRRSGTGWIMIGQPPSTLRRFWIRYWIICFRRCKDKVKAALWMKWRFAIPSFLSALAAAFRSVLFMTGLLVRCHLSWPRNERGAERKCGLCRCRKTCQSNVQWSRCQNLRGLSCCRSFWCMGRLHCVFVSMKSCGWSGLLVRAPSASSGHLRGLSFLNFWFELPLILGRGIAS